MIAMNFSRWTIACATLLGSVLLPIASNAQQGAPANAMCVRLEAQLAMIDRGPGSSMDPGRADQLRRYEEAAGRQQAELDRVTMQGRRLGCENAGFFSIFSNQPPQCSQINNEAQNMRRNLDQLITSIERLRVGNQNDDRSGQRRSVLLALAQNNCGPQYAAAARNLGGGGGGGGGPGNFFDNFFGNNSNRDQDFAVAPPDSGAPSGTYRTVCVRTCDGYYFPISFATVQSRFSDDDRSCKAQCPATDAALYTYRNPGEDMNSAVSINGAPYSSLPNAFKYRKEYDAACSCKAAGQTWSDALKSIDDRASLNRGDIIVTDERAKRMAQPKAPAKGATSQAPATAAPAAAGATSSQGVRSVGPTFLPNQQ